MSKQRNTTMTWRQVKDWLDRVNPSDLNKPAIIYDIETECFAAVAGCCLATPDEAGEIVWGGPGGRVGEGQPILKIW